MLNFKSSVRVRWTFRVKNRYCLLNININHKNYNLLDFVWFKILLFFINSLAKLLSDSLLLDSS